MNLNFNQKYVSKLVMRDDRMVFSIEKSIIHFLSLLHEILKKKDRANICLTGGTAANKFYNHAFRHDRFINYSKKCNFFISDERWVSLDSCYSNAGAILRLASSIPELKLNFNYFDTLNFSPIESLIQYSSILPSYFDLLLLGVGMDGHIASLFRREYDRKDLYKNVVLEDNAPKFPSQRLSISPSMVSGAANTIVLAGLDKKQLIDIFLSGDISCSKYPMGIMNNPNWYILD